MQAGRRCLIDTTHFSESLATLCTSDGHHELIPGVDPGALLGRNDALAARGRVDAVGASGGREVGQSITGIN